MKIRKGNLCEYTRTGMIFRVVDIEDDMVYDSYRNGHDIKYCRKFTLWVLLTRIFRVFF